MTIATGNAQAERRARSQTLNWTAVGGALFGVLTQVFFLWTVVQLFLFLRFAEGTNYAGWWYTDALMAIGFAIPHSLLLTRGAHTRLKRWIPRELIGCLHCCVTCGSLLLLIGWWGKSDWTLWQTSGWANVACQIGFYVSWFALVYSLWWSGLGYQTGLTPWWYWIRGRQQPVREIVTRGPYRWMRHPVYVSFLGLIWFTPTMSVDHVILTAIWSIYIFAGSHFKDRRLLYFLGSEYRMYAERVVGLPIIGFGSLRRFKCATAAE